MMIKKLTAFALLTGALLTTQQAIAADGLVTVKSSNDVDTTVSKLVSILESKGMNVFGRVNHAEGAMKAGLKLRPTQLVIFGNPKVGTPLMQCSQSIAIDLPQKMLAWEAEDGTVYLSFNDPSYLKDRHSTKECDAVFEKVSGALNNFAKAATAP